MPRDDHEQLTDERRELDERVTENRRRLGERIADLRAPLEISQEQLAEMAGISRRTVQRIEAGTADPRYGDLLRIAAILGVPVSVLIEGLDDVRPHPSATGEADERGR
ncbi:helix-turn-helix domain-containing protein [Streptomyces sp. NPDC004237]|uniref:helix-turn-helix transcriptional regulator n=1 Tax=Streptomyces sp. NPDC004237 TaxID=3154455 RepID=UPI0033AE2BE9